MTRSIRLGTGGWWGIIAEDFTLNNVSVWAEAVADYLKQDRCGDVAK